LCISPGIYPTRCGRNRICAFAAHNARLHICVEPDSHLVNVLHGREKLTAAWIKDGSPALPEFLRTAMAAGLTSDDFEQLAAQVRKKKATKQPRLT